MELSTPTSIAAGQAAYSCERGCRSSSTPGDAELTHHLPPIRSSNSRSSCQTCSVSTSPLALSLMSAMGHKRTCHMRPGMSAFRSKPDITTRSAERPLSAISTRLGTSERARDVTYMQLHCLCRLPTPVRGSRGPDLRTRAGLDRLKECAAGAARPPPAHQASTPPGPTTRSQVCGPLVGANPAGLIRRKEVCP